MICINCTYPAESLYVVYSNNHIQLTECNNCHDVVDKYIEIDNVLLSIDLLLLKPEAYRHLVYNSLESNLDKYTSWVSINTKNSWRDNSMILIKNVKTWCLKYDMMNRLWFLLFTFETYLKWVSEENKYKSTKVVIPLTNSTVYDRTVMERIYKFSPLNQYLYFALYSVLDISLFHYLLQYSIISFLHWGKSQKHAKSIISYTILLSYGAKIFPVLMLIWPYDTPVSMNIIKWVANLYVIESLKIVTGFSYSLVIQIFIITSVVRLTIVKSLLFLLICNGDFEQFKVFVSAEVVATMSLLDFSSLQPLINFLL